MIVCQRQHLEARCIERGYTLDEVMPCVVSVNGQEWTVDADHPAYPRTPRPGFEAAVSAASTRGPGTELKALLAMLGITAASDCGCNARANYMDRMEADNPGWCAANIDEIVGWLRESAAERGLPFLDAAGRLLVRRAIANARKKGAAANAEGSRLHAER